MKDKKVDFRIEGKVYKEMESAAKRAGSYTVSKWLRLLVNEELQRRRRERWEP